LLLISPLRRQSISLDSGGEVVLVRRDLGVDACEGLGCCYGGGGVGVGCYVCLLDCETTAYVLLACERSKGTRRGGTEWTISSSVEAPHCAYIASRSTNTSHILRHRQTQRRNPPGIRLLNSQIRLPTRPIRIARKIHITTIRARSIRIKLVNRHSHISSLRNTRDSLVRQLSFGLGTDVDVAGEKSAPAFVDYVLGDFGGVDYVCVGGFKVDLEGEGGG
jgi:hypothetical protein